MSAVTAGSTSRVDLGVLRDTPNQARGFPTGSSSAGFIYWGTSVDPDKNIWIVVKANTNMSVTGRTADGAGWIFDPDPNGGEYCWLNIGTNGEKGSQNWTVKARTTRDGRGGGVTYSAGTGGGPGGA